MPIQDLNPRNLAISETSPPTKREPLIDPTRIHMNDEPRDPTFRNLTISETSMSAVGPRIQDPMKIDGIYVQAE